MFIDVPNGYKLEQKAGCRGQIKVQMKIIAHTFKTATAGRHSVALVCTFKRKARERSLNLLPSLPISA